MKTQLQVGDTVAWSAKFLRSIADYSHKSASLRFTVDEVVWIGGKENPHMVILNLKRKDNGQEMGGLATNFVKADELHKEAH